MAWDANHIFWAEQIRVMATILPAIFGLAALFVWAAPRLVRSKQKRD